MIRAHLSVNREGNEFLVNANDGECFQIRVETDAEPVLSTRCDNVEKRFICEDFGDVPQTKLSDTPKTVKAFEKYLQFLGSLYSKAHSTYFLAHIFQNFTNSQRWWCSFKKLLHT